MNFKPRIHAQKQTETRRCTHNYRECPTKIAARAHINLTEHYWVLMSAGVEVFQVAKHYWVLTSAGVKVIQFVKFLARERSYLRRGVLVSARGVLISARECRVSPMGHSLFIHFHRCYSRRRSNHSGQPNLGFQSTFQTQHTLTPKNYQIRLDIGLHAVTNTSIQREQKRLQYSHTYIFQSCIAEP